VNARGHLEVNGGWHPSTVGGIIGTMHHTTSRTFLLTLLALSVGGCGFFLPPDEPPTPPTGTETMTCGETRSVDGLSGSDSIPLDVPLLSNFEVLADFEPVDLGMRVSRVTDSAIERSLELWDPYRNQRLISGTHDVQAELTLELLGTSSLFSGSVTLNCDQPSENCFNLVDDDGDGFIDCSDLNCSQSPGCQSDQADFEAVDLTCSDELLELSTSLGSTDDQRTLYRTHPGGSTQPGLEFWGGAEVVVRSGEAEMTNITLTLNNPAMVCAGLDDEPADAEVINCAAWERVESGETLTVDPTELPVFIEPLDDGLDNLLLEVECAAP
jgi:hypothetical protein